MARVPGHPAGGESEAPAEREDTRPACGVQDRLAESLAFPGCPQTDPLARIDSSSRLVALIPSGSLSRLPSYSMPTKPW